MLTTPYFLVGIQTDRSILLAQRDRHGREPFQCHLCTQGRKPHISEPIFPCNQAEESSYLLITVTFTRRPTTLSSGWWQDDKSRIRRAFWMEDNPAVSLQTSGRIHFWKKTVFINPRFCRSSAFVISLSTAKRGCVATEFCHARKRVPLDHLFVFREITVSSDGYRN